MALKLEERDDLIPLCPYCEEPLEKVFFHKVRDAMTGRRMAYICPHCQHLLGFGPS